MTTNRREGEGESDEREEEERGMGGELVLKERSSGHGFGSQTRSGATGRSQLNLMKASGPGTRVNRR